jgi:diaminohydroxyphosphoribosylaminopyrimidine deaminase/5-amino-6-(5-phosphoribosylamino)uracil reductase
LHTHQKPLGSAKRFFYVATLQHSFLVHEFMTSQIAACGGAATEDIYWMRRALVQAQNSLYLSNPNPRVGCVIVRDGELLAQGFTQAAGSRHAEAQALFEAAQQGVDVGGATAYVSLEPCSHTGRTPPCADALIHAGLARLVCTVQDPNPQVAGQGAAKLQAAGLAVQTGVLAQEAKHINIGFFSRMQRARPWLRLKIAASLDGFTALPNGQSQWITGEQARQDGHAWRARACAVLTGVGTVLADDPLLNVRGIAVQRQPHVLIVDSQLRTPTTAKLLAAQAVFSRKIVIFHLKNADAAKAAALQAAGAEAGLQLVALPADAAGRVDLPALLAWLQANLPVNELHIEAGATLNGALLQAGLADEVLYYQAPKLLGAGRPAAVLPAYQHVDEAPALLLLRSETLGADTRMQFLTASGQAFWSA